MRGYIIREHGVTAALKFKKISSSSYVLCPPPSMHSKFLQDLCTKVLPAEVSRLAIRKCRMYDMLLVHNLN